MQRPGPVVIPVAAPTKIEVGQANHTLYIQNLNERIPIQTLIKTLKESFEKHGVVVQVIAKRRLAMRGQAFVIYDNVDSARQALEQMQGRRLYGKSMVVRYARFKSDIIAKREGCDEEERRRRDHDKAERAKHPRITRRQLMAQMMSNPATSSMMGGIGVSAVPVPFGVGGDIQLPNKILFIQNVPSTIGEAQLVDVFRRFSGFVEVRLVPNRPDVAFVEYEQEQAANVARSALDKHEIVPGEILRVSFARR